jgi:hypothetical protein
MHHHLKVKENSSRFLNHDAKTSHGLLLVSAHTTAVSIRHFGHVLRESLSLLVPLFTHAVFLIQAYKNDSFLLQNNSRYALVQ